MWSKMVKVCRRCEHKTQARSNGFCFVPLRGTVRDASPTTVCGDVKCPQRIGNLSGSLLYLLDGRAARALRSVVFVYMKRVYGRVIVCMCGVFVRRQQRRRRRTAPSTTTSSVERASGCGCCCAGALALALVRCAVLLRFSIFRMCNTQLAARAHVRLSVNM